MIILEIIPQLPNLTPNYKTHKTVGKNFGVYIQVDIYMVYVSTLKL